MKFNLSEPRFVSEARQQYRWHRKLPRVVELLIEIGLFLLVFFVANILQGLIAAVALVPLLLGSLPDMTAEADSSGFASAMEISSQVMGTPAARIISLFATIALIAACLLYCRFAEGRKVSTLGFRREHIMREYLVGLGIGLAIFSLAVLICVVTGTLTYAGLAHGSAGLILLFFVGFLFQGMSEEVLCRGYFMVSLARRQNLILAIIVSSSAFGALHLLNPGVGVLPVINIALFGCFMAVYFIKRGNIWGIAAIHSMWNFTQGNIFGIQVSGLDKMPSVFAFDATSAGSLINGGAFGLEGGLAVTVVLVAALIVALLMKPKDPAPPLASFPPPVGIPSYAEPSEGRTL